MVNKEMKFLDNGDIRYEVVDASARSNIQTINTVLDTKADTSNVAALDTRVTGVEEDRYKPYVTDSVSGAVVSFPDGADDVPLKSLVVNIDPVQSGSGDPSPDNVRPISGWTGANVVRTGINQWDEEWEVGSIRQTDGLFVPDNTRIRSKNYNPCVPETTYYVKDPTNSNNISLRWYDANKGFISSSSWIGDTTITSPANAYYFVFVLASSYGITYNHDISINYPATDHDYHPYVGQTIPIDWQTEAGTVYGGKLDVLSGVLTVDRAMVDLGALDWIAPNENRFYTTSLSSVIKKGPNGALWIQSSMFRTTSALGVVYNSLDAMWLSASGNITVSKIADTAAALKTAVTGQQLVYELAEPLTVQLSANQINSLLGVNNLWADSGDTTVEYRADTKLFIERLTAPDSADMVADANITSGQYFMVGNSLFKATANIASGSAVVVGTNATRKSLSEALNEINA